MSSLLSPVLNAIDSLLEWMGTALHQNATSYVDLETADNKTTLVGRDGSLISVIRIKGARYLVGTQEFTYLHEGVTRALQVALSRSGHAIQMMFSYDQDGVQTEIQDILSGAYQSAEQIGLDLKDLLTERSKHLSRYCAKEENYLVLFTRPSYLSRKQKEVAEKRKRIDIKKHKIPPMKNAQSVVAALNDLRDTHYSFVQAIVHDFNDLGLDVDLLDVHTAVYHIRMSVDPLFTDKDWLPVLPGDPIPVRANKDPREADVSDIMWPDLSRQIMPRDGEIINLKFARIGDRIYAPICIDLFPKELQSFIRLFHRMYSANIPWRIAFMVESDGLSSIRFKSNLSAILSFASSQNPLITDASKYLKYIETNTDDSVVKLRVALATWAPVGKIDLLRQRAAELAKGIQGWGHCEVAEISGDAFGGTLSSALAVSSNTVATPSVAPLSDVVLMLPTMRPSSTWKKGALLFRSPDGKIWPYQPGSSQQTTWIDLIYARPGSGKSVLSNTINLALCLNDGLQRLPRIAIIDIGPSSSGLISLLKEALPREQRHLVAYHRLRMTPDYAINPFDTQLGSRYPGPLERSFLVNFLTLLVTPIGEEKAYDGVSDMAGMVVDELYKSLADSGNPNLYTAGINKDIDKKLVEINFSADAHTTWWEITDNLFKHGFSHEAMLAQRYAMPLLADVTTICRIPAIEDLFGRVIVSTQETLIQAFSRMISSAVREYPILSRVSAFDLGDARIVSLDLDEVAKTGGAAADRQTAVMYMLSRYVLAKDYYLTQETVQNVPDIYRDYHFQRIHNIRDDAKRIVFDEFHRTAKVQAVREQVIVDMREGRKWKVQIALLSQSLDDFDSIMVDFGTSIFVMDAGPAQAIEKTAKIFGLSDTAKEALRTSVHGPRPGGGTFLAQFSTKSGVNTQILTNTIGPVELWAFSTTAEDVKLRNILYERMGPKNARQALAKSYPSGSISSVVEQRLARLRETNALSEGASQNVIEEISNEIMNSFQVRTDTPVSLQE